MKNEEIELKLKNLNNYSSSVDVVDAAYYMLQLFCKTEGKYNCNRFKIEKLLAIAQLVFMRHNRTLFADDILVNNSGVSIPVLVYYVFCSDIKGKKPDNGKKIDEIEINNLAIFPSIYRIKNEIPEFVQDLLKKIFLKFGNYSEQNLAEIFNTFTWLISTSKSDFSNRKVEVIDCYKTFNFFDSEIAVKKYQNDIIDFVDKYDEKKTNHKIKNNEELDYIDTLKNYVESLELEMKENKEEAKRKALIALIATGVIDKDGNLKERIVTESHYSDSEEKPPVKKIEKKRLRQGQQ